MCSYCMLTRVLWLKKHFFNVFLVILFTPYFLTAQPQAPAAVSGAVSIAEQMQTLTVTQSSPQAIVNWESFAIGAQEKLEFIQPSAQATIINKVTGDLLSEINGTLQANGKVYLINPAGIIIGKEGVVNTQGFFAAAFALDAASLLQPEAIVCQAGENSRIVNLGLIETGGDIFLLAKELVNAGSITAAGSVNLMAADQLILKPQNNEIAILTDSSGSIDCQGSISALQCRLQAAGGNAYSLAINQDGIIEALGFEEKDGQILLIAETGEVDVGGSLRAQTADSGGKIHVLGDIIFLKNDSCIDVNGNSGGGEALIGGDYQGGNPDIKNAQKVFVAPEAFICANALENGDGGKLIFWGDELNVFYGRVEAKGGFFFRQRRFGGGFLSFKPGFPWKS